MKDVIIFAGPIILRPTFYRIDWMGADVEIVPIAGSGSQNFKNMGMGLRDGNGRIVPNLIKKYLKGKTFDRLSICAYSAGHGLVNQLGLNHEDLYSFAAVVLDDAAFIWNGNPPTPGLSNWAAKGAVGDGLFVATSSRGKGENYLSGTDSVNMIWQEAARLSGTSPVPAQPKPPVTEGTWQQLGVSSYWGDIPTLTHPQHHDYAPTVWQAYLAPYLAPKTLSVSGYLR